MNIEIEQSLSRAYELIETDRLDEARSILKPLLETNNDNADAWWLYAHAVTDSETARLALNNVLRINPNYPEANELLQALKSQIGDEDIFLESASDDEPSFLPPVPPTLPGLDGAHKAGWDEADEEPSIPFWRRPAFLLLTGLILFLIIAALVILRPPGQSETLVTPTTDLALMSTPTSEVILAITETPSDAQQSPIATSAPVVTEASAPSDDFSDLYASLGSFSIPENGIALTQTNLGSTIMVDACTQPGPALRQSLTEIMYTIAPEADQFAGSHQAMGVRMLDCDTNTPLLIIASRITDMTEYANGTLTNADFESRWQPVG
jgi:hypothetical protein